MTDKFMNPTGDYRTGMYQNEQDEQATYGACMEQVGVEHLPGEPNLKEKKEGEYPW